MPTQSPFCRLSIANEKSLYLNYVYKHNLHGKVSWPICRPPWSSRSSRVMAPAHRRRAGCSF